MAGKSSNNPSFLGWSGRKCHTLKNPPSSFSYPLPETRYLVWTVPAALATQRHLSYIYICCLNIAVISSTVLFFVSGTLKKMKRMKISCRTANIMNTFAPNAICWGKRKIGIKFQVGFQVLTWNVFKIGTVGSTWLYHNVSKIHNRTWTVENPSNKDS